MINLFMILFGNEDFLRVRRRLYNRNLQTAKVAQMLINKNRILRFKSQNSLYIFLEDIKNPNLKNARLRFRPKQPYYQGKQNYGPIVDRLIERKILFTVPNGNRIEYHVNKRLQFSDINNK